MLGVSRPGPLLAMGSGMLEEQLLEVERSSFVRPGELVAEEGSDYKPTGERPERGEEVRSGIVLLERCVYTGTRREGSPCA